MQFGRDSYISVQSSTVISKPTELEERFTAFIIISILTGYHSRPPLVACSNLLVLKIKERKYNKLSTLSMNSFPLEVW